MRDYPYCIGIIVNGGYIPMAWVEDELSHKKLKKTFKKYRNDTDFIRPFQLSWYRFYNSKQEMKADLPMLKE